MKVKFEAICDVPDGINDVKRFLDFHFNEIKNVDVIYANVEEQPEDKEHIEGKVCPICGYNNKMKIVSLTDEYIEIYCPQCHSKFKDYFDSDNN